MNKLSTTVLFIFTYVICPQVDAKSSKPASDVTYWQSQGYGYFIKKTPTTLTFYDVTQSHCLLNSEESGDYDPANLISLTQGAELHWETLHPVKLKPLNRLPANCLNTANTMNAVGNFDVFWQTFAEHYAFSQTKQWNWEAQYSPWRNRLNKNSSSEELLSVLNDLITALQDGHAYIANIDGETLAMYEHKWNTFRSERIDIPYKTYIASATSPKIKSPRSFYHFLTQLHQKVIEQYFIDDSKKIHDAFLSASLPGNVQYLSIDHLREFADGNTLEDDIHVVDEVMTALLPQLRKSDGLIIDLRWNSGGKDQLGLRLLSHFINEPLIIGSKRTKILSGFLPENKIKVSPQHPKPYLGPIVILTSPLTVSAAEVLVLGLKARDKVKLFGEPSNGSFSDTLVKQLPNGWIFTLSNEQYLDTDGVHFESKGIPVDETFKYLNWNELLAGKDPALSAAQRYLSMSKTSENLRTPTANLTVAEPLN
ncbi:S41 family peptidase [Pseudoalteromonas sp. OOF1S-7]|uniref:S41 family peptidase n=1 Tax=Pseudoalteromonas sp. OOF1S-7 TaxID=2917757 RepID=UPI001EF4F5BF|nr:S41 family peptidase [Pseudoalteromonas sp. OOF1S-7]MCG7533581.1 S41 family peptidase [Pseudoalteromonas sp. OOF1S-7]